MRIRHILQRLLLVVVIGGVAVVCLSSSVLAAIVGLMTAALVTIDMLAHANSTDAPRSSPHDDVVGGKHDPTRETLSVDLSRRR